MAHFMGRWDGLFTWEDAQEWFGEDATMSCVEATKEEMVKFVIERGHKTPEEASAWLATH